MKVKRLSNKQIVVIPNFSLTAKSVKLLDELSRDSPNLRLECFIWHTGVIIHVPLHDMDFDWEAIHRLNA